ncbi:MAG: DUF4198 domain-containing protein [Methanothrix sp.]
MSDHMLWAEAQDKALAGDLLKAYAFFGHPSMSTSIFAPRIDSAFLLTPAGEKLSLALKKGDWLPGYGHMEYLFSDMMLDRSGDYVFGLVRTPGVYDLSWHGGKSGLFLTRSFAKVIIHADKDGQNVQKSQGTWDAGFPLEIIPEHAPYGVKAMESLKLNVKYLNRPMKASYYASYWAWDEQGDSRVQRGTTDEDGSFSVNLNRGGMWIIDAGLTLEESGTLIADDSRSKLYKAGDVLEYKTIQVKTELTIWVR